MPDAQTEEAKKYLPFTTLGLVLTSIGLLLLDGAIQYVVLILGVVLAVFAAIKIMQAKERDTAAKDS